MDLYVSVKKWMHLLMNRIQDDRGTMSLSFLRMSMMVQKFKWIETTKSEAHEFFILMLTREASEMRLVQFFLYFSREPLVISASSICYRCVVYWYEFAPCSCPLTRSLNRWLLIVQAHTATTF